MELFYLKLLILLSFSFLFSGTEPAFFSLSPWKLLWLKNQKNLSSKLIVALSDYRSLLLTTILIGNETVNILTSSSFAKLKFNLFPHAGSLVSIGFILLSTILLLLFGEVTPKIIALKTPVAFFRKTVFIVYPLSFLLMPFKRFFKNKDHEHKASIIDVIHIARQKGAINDFEAFFYESIFKATKTPALFAATPINKIKDKTVLKGHPFPETLPLSRAMEIMIKEKTNILTIDETGAISGIIRKKELIEYFTFSELSQFVLKDNIVKGEMPISLFEYYFDVSVEEKLFKTINGYVIHLFGRLPEKGESVKNGHLKFTVLEVGNKMIKKLKVEKLHD